MGEHAVSAIDGSLVEFDADIELPGVGWTSIGLFDLGGPQLEVTTSTPQWGDIIQRNHGIQTDKEYAYNGAQIAVGHRVERQRVTGENRLTRLGIWYGRHHVASTFAYHISNAEFIDRIRTLRFEEVENGVAVSGRSGAELVRTAHHAPQVLMPLSNVALLDVRQRTAAIDRHLPRWGGAEVRGGELYREVEKPHPILVLIGDSAVVWCFGTRDVPLSEVVHGVSNLSVVWTAS